METDNFPLNIAVTGEHGSGKSSFVNAIRGTDKGDERAAPTGPLETTKDVRPYPHPDHPNHPKVIFWDLPGVGASSYPAAEYVKKVEFERFDFFIIVSADRFRENDVKLAKEIQRMKKKFYFVRSRIDNNVQDEDSKRILTQIREDCVHGLQDQGFVSPQVFLVSSFDIRLYDFPLLADTLKRELPELKKAAFQSVMPNTSLKMIDEKKKAFQSKIKYFAALSAAVAAVPVPGVSVAVDLSLMVGVFTRYVFGFGLNNFSLNRVSRYTGVSYEGLRKVSNPYMAVKEAAPFLLLKGFVLCLSTAAFMRAEEGSRFIPLYVTPAAMILSVLTTYKALTITLGMLAENAQRVFKKTSV